MKASREHPHVILISLCSVRADHLGCYGYPRATSPHIDAFARDAIVFDSALTPWPKTAPSFCSVMTGLNPFQTGVLRSTPYQQLAPDVATLADRFKASGYRTGAFVTTPALSPVLGLNKGFEVYNDLVGNSAGATEKAIGWLQYHHTDASLLWLQFTDAHYPYHPDAKFNNMFVGDAHYDAARTVPLNSRPLDLTLPADHPAVLPELRPDIGGIHKEALLPEHSDNPDYYIAQYDAGIRSADEHIGTVLTSVRKVLGDEPYIVVLWSDHGESLGDHNYYFEHGRFPYDDCLHVPFMIYDPRRWEAGKHISQPVTTLDIAATLATMTGISKDKLDGTSLVDIVNGRIRHGDVFFCAGYQPDFMTGIRRDQFKLIRVPNPIDQKFMQHRPNELYDIHADPKEEHDLSAAHPDIVSSMGAALHSWQDSWYPKAVAMRPRFKGNYAKEDEKGLRALGYLGSSDGRAALSGGTTGVSSSRPAASRPASRH